MQQRGVCVLGDIRAAAEERHALVHAAREKITPGLLGGLHLQQRDYRGNLEVTGTGFFDRVAMSAAADLAYRAAIDTTKLAASIPTD